MNQPDIEYRYDIGDRVEIPVAESYRFGIRPMKRCRRFWRGKIDSRWVPAADPDYYVRVDRLVERNKSRVAHVAYTIRVRQSAIRRLTLLELLAEAASE